MHPGEPAHADLALELIDEWRDVVHQHEELVRFAEPLWARALWLRAEIRDDADDARSALVAASARWVLHDFADADAPALIDVIASAGAYLTHRGITWGLDQPDDSYAALAWRILARQAAPEMPDDVQQAMRRTLALLRLASLTLPPWPRLPSP